MVTFLSPSSLPAVAIHPEQNKLLKDALSWLTLRQDGNPLSPSQGALFIESLHKKYRSSALSSSLSSLESFPSWPYSKGRRPVTLHTRSATKVAWTIRWLRTKLKTSHSKPTTTEWTCPLCIFPTVIFEKVLFVFQLILRNVIARIAPKWDISDKGPIKFINVVSLKIINHVHSRTCLRNNFLGKMHMLHAHMYILCS